MPLLILIRCDTPGCEAEARSLWPHGHRAHKGMGWQIPTGGRCTPTYCPAHARRAG